MRRIDTYDDGEILELIALIGTPSQCNFCSEGCLCYTDKVQSYCTSHIRDFLCENVCIDNKFPYPLIKVGDIFHTVENNKKIEYEIVQMDLPEQGLYLVCKHGDSLQNGTMMKIYDPIMDTKLYKVSRLNKSGLGYIRIWWDPVSYIGGLVDRTPEDLENDPIIKGTLKKAEEIINRYNKKNIRTPTPEEIDEIIKKFI